MYDSEMRNSDLQESVVVSQSVLDMQQVLCGQLAQAKDAHEVDLCQISSILRLQVAKGDSANTSLQGLNVGLPDLQQTSNSLQSRPKSPTWTSRGGTQKPSYSRNLIPV